MRFQHNPFSDKLDISGMGPGATTVEFVTGNDGIPVPSDAAYNLNLLGNNTQGINITGVIATSTVTVAGINASTTQIGVSRYATNVEAAAQASTSTALTPSNITSLFSSTPLPASQGGTGRASPAAHSLLVTNGSSAFTLLGTAGNGQIPIGSIGSDPVLANITSSGGTVLITNGPGTINLEVGPAALTFDTDSGTATPVASSINFLGTSAQGISSSASGDTVTYTIANATAAQKGVASFNSTNFTVTTGAVTSNAITVTSGANITATASWNLGGATSIAVSGTTNHAIQLGNVGGSLTSLGVATNGQIPIGSTGADPVLALPSNGNNISWTGGAGTLTANLTGTTNHTLQLGNAGGSLTSLGVATDGQIPIGSTGADPVLAALTAGTGVSITNGAGAITITASGSGMNTVEVTGTSASMVVDTAYIANNAGLVTLTLPVTAALGSVIEVIGKGAGGWLIAQNASQQIHVGSSGTTAGVGGSLASTNQWDSLRIRCITANNLWSVVGGPQGNITVV